MNFEIEAQISSIIIEIDKLEGRMFDVEEKVVTKQEVEDMIAKMLSINLKEYVKKDA